MIWYTKTQLFSWRACRLITRSSKEALRYNIQPFVLNVRWMCKASYPIIILLRQSVHTIDRVKRMPKLLPYFLQIRHTHWATTKWRFQREAKSLSLSLSLSHFRHALRGVSPIVLVTKHVSSVNAQLVIAPFSF